MLYNRPVEYIFFFGLLGIVAFLVWKLFAPFVTALALAGIIVTICYPLYLRVQSWMPRHNASASALLTTLLVIIIIGVPAAVLGLLLFREAADIYRLFSSGSAFSLTESLTRLEGAIRQVVPEFSLDVTGYVQQAAAFTSAHLAAIFTSTASTLFTIFISLIATFYFFRDGRSFTKLLIEISPLPDKEDTIILHRLARSVRSVAVGVILVALIQGILTSIGLSLFGFDRAILWGAVAAFGALIPGVGTSIVFVPSVLYLVFTGAYFKAVGVAIWATFAVGLIDNFLGPYFISRGGTLHPFFILISALGGIAFFGPIGFVVGPVLLSLFKVLLELYASHIAAADQRN
jgi:predicted PurR-regulated permease PerM